MASALSEIPVSQICLFILVKAHILYHCLYIAIHVTHTPTRIAQMEMPCSL